MSAQRHVFGPGTDPPSAGDGRDLVQPGAVGPVDRSRFVELVETAVERSAAGRIQVAVVHIGLTDAATEQARLPRDDRLARRLTGRLLEARLRAHLEPRDVLGRLGPAEYAVLCSGAGPRVLSRARAVAEELSGPLASTVAVVVDSREEAETLIAVPRPGPV
ncbi:hypothetical protein G4X40_11475 [Rhodococcus sp. D2-41]|uniref:hypothetical protein n=1 Tax=Speluncibacter jeojiensis TaxID=2710754 RepID=UPI00240F2858|nr:hypothetical protein [Rhodococcus sp. D2-41]MDG3010768.1 hypothetical protein [Rhodococcus sp. D2-41]